MSSSRRARKNQSRRSSSFCACLRQLLTPSLFKQVSRSLRVSRKAARWQMQPLLFVLLTMTWCSGDSLAERFEIARGYYVVCHLKRRRPGKSFSGFQEAVARLPTRALRVVTGVLRRNIPPQIGDRWLTDDCCPLGAMARVYFALERKNSNSD